MLWDYFHWRNTLDPAYKELSFITLTSNVFATKLDSTVKRAHAPDFFRDHHPLDLRVMGNKSEQSVKDWLKRTTFAPSNIILQTTNCTEELDFEYVIFSMGKVMRSVFLQ